MRRFMLPLFVAASLALAAAGRADTVLIDSTFSAASSTTLNNSTPETTVNSAKWVASGLTFSGGTLAMNTATPQIAYIDMGSGYFASNAGIYTLAATYSLPAGTSAGWLGLGFVVPSGIAVPGITNTWSTSSTLSSNTVGSEPWLFNRQAGNVNVYAGPYTTNPLLSGGTSVGPSGSSLTVQLVLNTSLPQWTLDAYVGSTQLDLNGAAAGNTYTYATNPSSIEDIALGTSGTGNFTASVSEFKLSYVAAPEPGAWALAGLGALALLLRARFRARAA